MFVLFTSCFFLTYAIMPIGGLAAKFGGDSARRDALVWTAIVAILTPTRASALVFP
jgi:hypothetical protein